MILQINEEHPTCFLNERRLFFKGIFFILYAR